MKPQFFSYEKSESLGRVYGGMGRNILSHLTFSKTNILMFLASFLLGRVSLFQGTMPFGIAFFAAASTKTFNKILMAMAVLAGMITGGAVEEVFTAFVFIGIFSLLNKILKNIKLKEDYKIAIIGLISALIPQIYMVYLKGLLLYDLLMAIFYSGLIFSLIFIFRSSGLLSHDVKKNTYSNEEIISIAVLAALLLSSVSDINFMGFTLTNILGILSILIFSTRLGPGVGAAVGVIVGLVVSMSNPGGTTCYNQFLCFLWAFDRCI